MATFSDSEVWPLFEYEGIRRRLDIFDARSHEIPLFSLPITIKAFSLLSD